MHPLLLKYTAVAIENPVAHFRLPTTNIDSVAFRSELMFGTYYRVMPQTMADIRFLQSLTHNEEKFVVDGDGVVISEKAFLAL